MKLFGWEITKKVEPKVDKKEVERVSFAPPRDDEGSVSSVISAGGHYGHLIDLDGSSAKNDKDLILRYRSAAIQSEVDMAINDIVDAAIVSDSIGAPVELDLSESDLSDAIKKKIYEEFENITELFNLQDTAFDLFRNWYIDGRVFFHIIIDSKKPKDGIKELRQIDPLFLRKVKEYKSEKDPQLGIEIKKLVDEYYIYDDSNSSLVGRDLVNASLKIAKDAIIQVTSGQIDPATGCIMSNLHKALKAINNLRMLEDALVVYRISRAPERRIFYIDVGNLPKGKAETYVQNIMAKYRNKLVYDSTTGEVQDSPKHMAMLEDFWLPRMEGGRGTEITTLPGGENLGNIEDVIFFQRKLYRALNVPLGRLESENGFSLGRASEITREEVKFQKFISRLRKRFSKLFLEALKTQIILKGIISVDEWYEISQKISIDYIEDSHFTELKELEILRERIDMLASLDEYSGKFFSNKYIRMNVLRQSEEDIERINAEIEEEKENEDDGIDGAEFE